VKKTLLSLAALLSLSLALTSCGGGATNPNPDPVVDTTAPSVVSVTPSSGATGVSKDANVVITFSEPMDQASAQAAFQSADLGTFTFSWNVEGTTMTVNPNVDLTYNSSGKSYGFKVTTTAKDKANNALPSETSSSFKTFKQLSSTIISTAALDGNMSSGNGGSTSGDTAVTGDGMSNLAYRAFFSFDISSLPAGVQPGNVFSATLKVYQSKVQGTPYTSLKTGVCPLNCEAALLDHVNYGSSLTGEDFETPVLHDLGNLSTSSSLETKTANVLVAVRDDLDKRDTRGNRSQYRVRFPLGTNADDKFDWAEFNTAEAASNKPTLEISYLIP